MEKEIRKEVKQEAEVIDPEACQKVRGGVFKPIIEDSLRYPGTITPAPGATKC